MFPPDSPGNGPGTLCRIAQSEVLKWGVMAGVKTAQADYGAGGAVGAGAMGRRGAGLGDIITEQLHD